MGNPHHEMRNDASPVGRAYSSHHEAKGQVRLGRLTAEHYRKWKGWTDEDFGGYSADAAWFRLELYRSGVRDLRGRRVLEIGLGNGGFAMWATQQGAVYWGTELDETLVSRAKSRGITAYSSYHLQSCLSEATPVHLIVAWDVLEHVPRVDLPDMLATLRQCLSDDGVLIARMPSGDSPFSRAIQYGDLTHEPPLGSTAAGVLAQQAGFTRVKIRPACLPIWGGVPRSVLRRLFVRLIEVAARPVVVALMRNPYAIITPNMVLTLRP